MTNIQFMFRRIVIGNGDNKLALVFPTKANEKLPLKRLITFQEPVLVYSYSYMRMLLSGVRKD